MRPPAGNCCGSDGQRRDARAIERHYGVRLAFQNCHRAAVFRPAAEAAYQEFITARSQILNQRPYLINC